MKNQPTSIFLDLGFDPLETISNDFNSLLSVTWSKDNATGNGLEYVSKESVRDEIDGYKSALGDLRAETELKACIFAEWTHKVAGLTYNSSVKRWYVTTLTTVLTYSTAELFASPEFLEYYQQRKSK